MTTTSSATMRLEDLRQIEAIPLTASDFAPFGSVLGTPLQTELQDIIPALGVGTAINDATGVRFDHPAPLDLKRSGGTPLLALFKTQGDAHRAPYRLRAFERHQQGGQTFAPLGASRCLAIVALGSAEPDLSSIRAFMVEPGQVVTLRASLWHHPLLTIGPAMVLVLERSAASIDCEIWPIKAVIDVTLPDVKIARSPAAG